MKAIDIMRRTLIVVLIFTLVMTFSFLSSEPDNAYASSNGTCGVIPGDNSSDQDYGRWSEPVRSYLVNEGSQLMRVQASDEAEGRFQVSYYDPTTYKALSRMNIITDLPIFGGFATDGNYYYVVTGQNNTGRSDSVEVFRVQKFDKNWNSLGYDSLYGANTMYPFDAGCCRFAFAGNYMVVRTAHEMYGGHQANVTILFNTSSLSITDSLTDVANIDKGYVSHSFNQFVQINNNKIVSLDHGDANPRSLVLCEYPTNITSGKFNSSSVTNTTVLSIYGSKNDLDYNTTGVTVGAFEMSSSKYLMAYSTVKQDSGMYDYDTSNIYVAAIDKSSKSIKREQFTYYEEGEGDTSTPHLVNIGGAYLLLWNEGNEVYCNKITANGVKVDDANTYLGYGYLSDCKPIFDSENYKVIWYDYDDGREQFYEIDLDSLKLNSYEYNYDHNHVYDSTSDGYANMKCTDCGDTYQVLVPTDFTAKWGVNSSYTEEQIPEPTTSSTLYYSFSLSYAEDDYSMTKLSDMVLEVNDPANCHIDQVNKNITFDKTGTYTFTAYPKYNPTLKKTYSITVTEALNSLTVTADKTTVKPGETVKLTASSSGGQEVHYLFSLYRYAYSDYYSYDSCIKESNEINTCDWTPEYTGTYKIKVTATDVGGDWTRLEDEIIITVKNETPASSGSTSDGSGGSTGNEGSSGTSTGDETSSDDTGISLVKYDASVTRISNRVYTGKRIKPQPIVKCFGVKLVKDRDYTISYKNNKSVGTAKVIIKGKGSYSGTITKTFKIIPKSAPIKKLTSKKKAIKVTWGKRSLKMSKNRITGYQIQYSTSSKFKSAKKIKVKGYKKTSYTIKKLKAKKKYYVRIRTYMKVGNKTYYSKWSAKKSVKTK